MSHSRAYIAVLVLLLHVVVNVLLSHPLHHLPAFFAMAEAAATPTSAVDAPIIIATRLQLYKRVTTPLTASNVYDVAETGSTEVRAAVSAAVAEDTCGIEWASNATTAAPANGTTTATPSSTRASSGSDTVGDGDARVEAAWPPPYFNAVAFTLEDAVAPSTVPPVPSTLPTMTTTTTWTQLPSSNNSTNTSSPNSSGTNSSSTATATTTTTIERNSSDNNTSGSPNGTETSWTTSTSEGTTFFPTETTTAPAATDDPIVFVPPSQPQPVGCVAVDAGSGSGVARTVPAALRYGDNASATAKRLRNRQLRTRLVWHDIVVAITTLAGGECGVTFADSTCIGGLPAVTAEVRQNDRRARRMMRELLVSKAALARAVPTVSGATAANSATNAAAAPYDTRRPLVWEDLTPTGGGGVVTRVERVMDYYEWLDSLTSTTAAPTNASALSTTSTSIPITTAPVGTEAANNSTTANSTANTSTTTTFPTNVTANGTTTFPTNITVNGTTNASALRDALGEDLALADAALLTSAAFAAGSDSTARVASVAGSSSADAQTVPACRSVPFVSTATSSAYRLALASGQSESLAPAPRCSTDRIWVSSGEPDDDVSAYDGMDFDMVSHGSTVVPVVATASSLVQLHTLGVGLNSVVNRDLGIGLETAINGAPLENVAYATSDAANVTYGAQLLVTINETQLLHTTLNPAASSLSFDRTAPFVMLRSSLAFMTVLGEGGTGSDSTSPAASVASSTIRDILLARDNAERSRVAQARAAAATASGAFSSGGFSAIFNESDAESAAQALSAAVTRDFSWLSANQSALAYRVEADEVLVTAARAAQKVNGDADGGRVILATKGALQYTRREDIVAVALVGDGVTLRTVCLLATGWPDLPATKAAIPLAPPEGIYTPDVLVFPLTVATRTALAPVVALIAPQRLAALRNGTVGGFSAWFGRTLVVFGRMGTGAEDGFSLRVQYLERDVFNPSIDSITDDDQGTNSSGRSNFTRRVPVREIARSRGTRSTNNGTLLNDTNNSSDDGPVSTGDLMSDAASSFGAFVSTIERLPALEPTDARALVNETPFDTAGWGDTGALPDSILYHQRRYMLNVSSAVSSTDPTVVEIMEPIASDTGQSCYLQESPLSMLAADSLRWRVPDADIGLIAACEALVRFGTIPVGPFHLSDLQETYEASSRHVCRVRLLGLHVSELVRGYVALSPFEAEFVAYADHLLVPSGMRVSYGLDATGAHTVVGIEVWSTTSEAYEPLDRMRYYTIATSSYVCSSASAELTALFAPKYSGETLTRLPETVQHAIWAYGEHLVYFYPEAPGFRNVNYNLSIYYPDLIGIFYPQTEADCSGVESPERFYADVASCLPRAVLFHVSTAILVTSIIVGYTVLRLFTSVTFFLLMPHARPALRTLQFWFSEGCIGARVVEIAINVIATTTIVYADDNQNRTSFVTIYVLLFAITSALSFVDGLITTVFLYRFCDAGAQLPLNDIVVWRVRMQLFGFIALVGGSVPMTVVTIIAYLDAPGGRLLAVLSFSALSAGVRIVRVREAITHFYDMLKRQRVAVEIEDANDDALAAPPDLQLRSDSEEPTFQSENEGDEGPARKGRGGNVDQAAFVSRRDDDPSGQRLTLLGVRTPQTADLVPGSSTHPSSGLPPRSHRKTALPPLATPPVVNPLAGLPPLANLPDEGEPAAAAVSVPADERPVVELVVHRATSGTGAGVGSPHRRARQPRKFVLKPTAAARLPRNAELLMDGSSSSSEGEEDNCDAVSTDSEYFEPGANAALADDDAAADIHRLMRGPLEDHGRIDGVGPLPLLTHTFHANGALGAVAPSGGPPLPSRSRMVGDAIDVSRPIVSGLSLLAGGGDVTPPDAHALNTPPRRLPPATTPPRNGHRPNPPPEAAAALSPPRSVRPARRFDPAPLEGDFVPASSTSQRRGDSSSGGDESAQSNSQRHQPPSSVASLSLRLRNPTPLFRDSNLQQQRGLHRAYGGQQQQQQDGYQIQLLHPQSAALRLPPVEGRGLLTAPEGLSPRRSGSRPFAPQPLVIHQGRGGEGTTTSGSGGVTPPRSSSDKSVGERMGGGGPLQPGAAPSLPESGGTSSRDTSTGKSRGATPGGGGSSNSSTGSAGRAKASDGLHTAGVTNDPVRTGTGSSTDRPSRRRNRRIFALTAERRLRLEVLAREFAIGLAEADVTKVEYMLVADRMLADHFSALES